MSQKDLENTENEVNNNKKIFFNNNFIGPTSSKNPAFKYCGVQGQLR